MKTIVNPTRTHIHRGYLEVGVDFIPEIGDGAYDFFNLPVIPPDATEAQRNDPLYLSLLPKAITPCLTAFVTVPETVTQSDMDAWREQNIDGNVIASLNSMWKQYEKGKLKGHPADYTSPLFRHRCVYKKEKVKATNHKALISDVNAILTGKETNLGIDNTPVDLESESITVGLEVVGRASYTYDTFTYVDKNGPATGTGEIDTIDFQVEDTTVDTFFGIFYFVSGTTWKSREGTGDLGVFAAGLRQATGLTLDVVETDIIGTYSSDSSSGHPIERDTSGFDGIIYSGTGNYTTTDASTTYSTAAGDALALYGTGEAAGGVDYPISISTAGLTASATVAYLAAWDRATTPGLTVSTTITKAFGFVRSLITQIGLSVEMWWGGRQKRIVDHWQSDVPEFPYTFPISFNQVKVIGEVGTDRIVNNWSSAVPEFPYTFPISFNQVKVVKKTGTNRELGEVGTNRNVESF